ncbi:hypothetical protein [Halomicrococcus sp. NG-SE-24]|uniref:hypothetical protein n=1 Tax=Halomicrococcus sp. NG-SE-24 TaxID=3436928 RepID=UPI003D985F09
MNVKQILGVLVALTVATTMFAGGALAQPVDDDSVTVDQDATASVSQSQDVSQANYNTQLGFAASDGDKKHHKKHHDGSSGDASVSQSNEQYNTNIQAASASASNTADVTVTNEDDDNDFPPGPP